MQGMEVICIQIEAFHTNPKLSIIAMFPIGNQSNQSPDYIPVDGLCQSNELY